MIDINGPNILQKICKIQRLENKINIYVTNKKFMDLSV